ncbi:MAG: hypothetical protein GX117_10210 [Candidatus Hydrogenedentes bacterium]|nr:hypothetical protein [Candidatus Hydrogenedentota bacterium]
MIATAKKSYQPGDPRLIMRWARSYAKSRTISFLVQWVFIMVMVICIGIAASLTHTAHQQGKIATFYLSVMAMVFAAAALVWFSISRWSSELIYNITNWLYGREGYASYSGSGQDGPMPVWLTGLGGGLLVYHLVGALLISFNYVSIRHMQPWSAAYMTPYLILMVLYQRLGFWAWIWPLLYGLHGIALFFGAPIRFSGELELLNIVVPIFGYGLIAILTGHLYSRYALWKLKTLTRGAIPQYDDMTTSDAEEDQPEDTDSIHE